MIVHRDDEAPRKLTLGHVKTDKSIQSVQIPIIMYQATPLLRQRDRDQFKIPRVRLYHVILREERIRGGEEIKMPKRSVRQLSCNMAKGIRI